MYDYDQVKELVHLVATTGVGELEVERNGFRLRIVGHMPTPTAYVSAPPALPVAAPVPAEPPRTSANLVGAGRRRGVISRARRPPTHLPDRRHVLCGSGSRRGGLCSGR